jgi:hypothetical protein
VFQGNSQDFTNDAFLYVDYVLQASGNMEDTSVFGGTTTGVITGEVFGTTAMNTDEVRYTDAPLAMDGSEFLRTVGIRTTINTETGNLRIINDSLQSVNLGSYQINSPLGRLLTDDLNWNSLSDQNLNPVSGGNDPGETWDESPNVGPNSLGETFLLGGTTLSPGGVLDLGTAYNEGMIDNGLSLSLYDLNSNSVIETLIQYNAGGIDGDHNEDGVVNAADYVFWRDTMGDTPRYNLWKENFGATSGSGASNSAIPEPRTIVLGMIASLLFTHTRRKRQ